MNPPQAGEGSASCERVRYLWVDALIGFGELDFALSRIAHGLHPTPFAEIGIVKHQMLLRGHRLHGGQLLLPHRGDIEQNLRLEIALLGLVRLEEEYWRRVVLPALARGGITRSLCVHARLQRE